MLAEAPVDPGWAGAFAAIIVGFLSFVLGPIALEVVKQRKNRLRQPQQDDEPAEPADSENRLARLIDRLDRRLAASEAEQERLGLMLRLWMAWAARAALQIVRLGGTPEPYPREEDAEDGATP